MSPWAGSGIRAEAKASGELRVEGNGEASGGGSQGSFCCARATVPRVNGKTTQMLKMVVTAVASFKVAPTQKTVYRF
jgi:hypothetical protein